MYRRPILCTVYGAVDFLNVLKKGCWVGWGGVLLVHNEIHYVPIGWFGRKKYWYVMHYITYQFFYSTPQNHYIPCHKNNRYINSYCIATSTQYIDEYKKLLLFTIFAIFIIFVVLKRRRHSF
jgi:hypothetical protein